MFRFENLFQVQCVVVNLFSYLLVKHLQIGQLNVFTNRIFIYISKMYILVMCIDVMLFVFALLKMLFKIIDRNSFVSFDRTAQTCK